MRNIRVAVRSHTALERLSFALSAATGERVPLSESLHVACLMAMAHPSDFRQYVDAMRGEVASNDQ